MQTNSPSRWWPRLFTFSVASLAAASAVYWVLQWPQFSASSTVPVAASSSAPADPQALARLLGSANAVAPVASAAPVDSAASRFVLTGVVAGASKGGAALIAIDGQAAKPFKVGSRVEAGLVLQSVAARRAVLAAEPNGPASMTLEMKALGR